jgi:beta-xylosidase
MDYRDTLMRVWVSQAQDRWRVSPERYEMDALVDRVRVEVYSMSEQQARELL